MTMEYFQATPRIITPRTLMYQTPLVYDNDNKYTITCGQGKFSEPVLVQSEILMRFDVSDQTWVLFVSEPTEFICSLPETEDDYFILQATKPMTHGMVRLALAHGCTKGLNPIRCHESHISSAESAEILTLLRTHADVYPTARADVSFTSTDKNSNKGLVLRWEPQSMSSLALKFSPLPTLRIPRTELLMYSLPHHTPVLQGFVGSSNRILTIGCKQTLHGRACPVTGGTWLLQEKIPITSFFASRPIRPELLQPIRVAMERDIDYDVDLIHLRGAGDTYFSGKMVAKLARILLLAEELGYSTESLKFTHALDRLKARVEIWFNGSAQNVFLYDPTWGGTVNCGCDINMTEAKCNNKFPTCPSVSDQQSNFGTGYYNDHHYHYGYFIYAVAVIAKYDKQWGKRYHEFVLLLIRDIANPSKDDEYFPVYRHKDWYLGSSWASGTITLWGTKGIFYVN